MQTNPFSNLIRTPLAGVFVALLVIFALSAILSPYFLTPYNLSVVARGLAFVGLITIAQSMLMVLGELDLSLGVIGGLSGVVSGILMVRMGFEPYSAMLLAILLGLCLGLFNGFLVTFLRLHSLVLTIGTAGIFGGANLVLTRGVAITGIPRDVQYLGRGDLFGVPVPFIIMFVALLVATFVMLKTPFGRYMYAIGNNRDGARMLGIRVDRVRLMVFGVAGAIAGLAGVLMVARLERHSRRLATAGFWLRSLHPSSVALPQRVVSAARLVRSSVQVSSLLLKTLSFCSVSPLLAGHCFRCNRRAGHLVRCHIASLSAPGCPLI